jgi:hypothetical protein
VSTAGGLIAMQQPVMGGDAARVVVPRVRPDDIGIVVARVIDPDGRRRIAVVL